MPTKGLFKENAPCIFFILMGSFARTLLRLFLNTSALTNSLLFRGQIIDTRFSNTSFGRTPLGSNFGGLLLEQTFCRHFAAFPDVYEEKKNLQNFGLIFRSLQ